MHQPGRQSPSSLKAVQKGDLKTGQFGGAKFQKPNSKSQTNSKFQKKKARGGSSGRHWLVLGLWTLEFVCDLEFEIWNLQLTLVVPVRPAPRKAARRRNGAGAGCVPAGRGHQGSEGGRLPSRGRQ